MGDLSKQGLSSSQFEGTAYAGRESWRQEPEASSHLVSTKEVEMDTEAQFRDQPVARCQPHSGCVFPSQQTNLKTSSPISQEVCLLGPSIPFQVSH